MAAAPELAPPATRETPHADLIARGEAAARAAADRRWGRGDHEVRNETRRASAST